MELDKKLKFSKDVLELRHKEQKLICLQRYEEAEVVAQKMKKLEEKETKVIEKQMKKHMAKRETKLRERQEKG